MLLLKTKAAVKGMVGQRAGSVWCRSVMAADQMWTKDVTLFELRYLPLSHAIS